LTIAAVGPQTNLALALATEPTLPEMVDDIYLMGGTAFERGNVTPSPRPTSTTTRPPRAA